MADLEKTSEAEVTVPQTDELKQAAQDVLLANHEAQRHASDALMYAIWCGSRLHDVKVLLKTERVFVAWLDQNVVGPGFSQSTAYRYLRVYERLTRDQQRALPEHSFELNVTAPPPVPAISLTSVYKEFGMVKPTVRKPSTRAFTAVQALSHVSLLRDRVQTTDFNKLSAADCAKFRAAMATVMERFEAALAAKDQTASAA